MSDEKVGRVTFSGSNKEPIDCGEVFESASVKKRFPRTLTELSTENDKFEKGLKALQSRVEILEEQSHYGDIESDEPLEAAHQELVADLRARRGAGLA